MKIATIKENRNNLYFSFGFCFLIILIILFNNSPRSLLITQKFFDPIRKTTERGEVVIVGIDDKTLQTIGSWPFNREVFANLTNKLVSYKSKEIVYDILFLENRIGDDIFLKAVSSSTVPIIFASKINKDMYLESYFSTTTNITKSAFADIFPDEDGEIRTIPNNLKMNDQCVSPMSRLSFNLYTHRNINCNNNQTEFFRYPDTQKSFSLIDVLNGKIDAKEFTDKVVFVGSDSLDLEDHFVSITGEKIPGVRVHASIFTSLLNKDVDILINNNITILLIFLIAILVVYFTYKIKHFSKQIAFFLVFIGIIFFVSYILFENHYILQTPILIFTAFIFEGYTTIFRFVLEKKKNDYIQNIFSKYVHKDVLDELLHSEKDIVLGGEKRRISILFSDLRGFTSFSEKMTPVELTNLLNDYLSAMSPIILNYKGTIDKYIGDAIMAFWNAPLYITNHENYAVLSAVLMQSELKKFNDKHKTELAMGIGVHVGDVVVGNVGSKERINYTILGDAVNTTSRLESLTKKYSVGIIVTNEIKNHVKDKRVSFRKLDEITVKGKKESTIIYEAFLKNDISEATVLNYEKAFDMYKNKNFIQAKEILSKQLNDKPSQMLLDRILFIENNKDFIFDGVWHFDEK